MHVSLAADSLVVELCVIFSTATPVPLCPSDKFDCYKNGTLCIEASKLCDGRKDCENFADEGNELCESKNLVDSLCDCSYPLLIN